MRFVAAFALVVATLAAAQSSAPLRVTVTDENGNAVPAAAVSLTAASLATPLVIHTDVLGHGSFLGLRPGIYHLQVQKPGFYELAQDVSRDAASEVNLVLSHQLEAREVVNVSESPPAIDPAQTQQASNLGTREIVNIPYPTTRDIRNVLPFIPGVVQDPTGEVHVAGAETYQTLDLLDGFDIRSPVSGRFAMRIGTDAVREINVLTSRYSAEYGKATGGVIALNSGMGDDHFRFSATNLPPSFNTKKGVRFDNWVPRATFSGPIKKGRAWFFDSADAEYDTNFVPELPKGANSAPVWRASNLAKVQMNLAPRNVLTSSLLLNGYHSEGEGLSVLNPLEITQIRNQTAYLADIKDQQFLSNGMLLEAGVAVEKFRDSFLPFGTRPYEIRPSGTSGNFFERLNGHSRRVEGIAKLFLPPLHARGRHDLSLGLNTDQINFDQQIDRRPIFIFREDGTLFRKSEFAAATALERNNLEFGAYAQDRWTLTDRLLLESGIRLDWDEIIRQPLFSPRVATTYMLNPATKFSGGVGLYYERTHLDYLARALTGPRLDTYYAANGTMPLGPPLTTSFISNERSLSEPAFLNWSLGVERKVLSSVYLSLEYLQRRGRNGFTFLNTNSADQAGTYALSNARRDRFDGFTVSARKAFAEDYSVFASYTRSSARSNAVLDFTIEDPIFSRQAGGPLAWDTPNRFISWGWLPFPKTKRFDFVYSMEWRNGFPFSVVNEKQQIVGAPDSRRFPDYLSLNPGLEWRFHFRDYQLALRGIVENVTAHSNPADVNNNISSPNFLQYSLFQRRAITGRIRFLGKKK